MHYQEVTPEEWDLLGEMSRDIIVLEDGTIKFVRGRLH